MKKNLTQFFSSQRRTKLTFIFLGIGSTIWFLLRVIPKPSRAAYPCMRAAAPIMSSFIIYLLGLGGSVMLFKSAVSRLKQAKYFSAALALVAFLFVMVVVNFNSSTTSMGNTDATVAELPDAPNTPMGVGQGIFPGRVVWEWNQAATNELCTNTKLSDSFVTPKNNNQDTINKMASNAILNLSGKNSVKEGWEALFQNFNNRKLGSPSGYQSGQTIFIKINNGQAGWNSNSMTLAENGTLPISETTPATVLALLTQLVDSCQIPQEKIFVSEPMTHIFKHMFDPLYAKYPNVKYLDKDSKYTSLKRTPISGWVSGAIQYSDGGAVMPDGISDALSLEMYDADYLINVAALKAHARNGVTLNAKLHFGSHGDHGGNDWGSFDLHNGLIATVNNDILDRGARTEYGMYRVLTDIMGHEKLGLNTVLFIVDGLWGGVEATDKGVKWKMPPFSNDWPNSLFFSQDGVAIESVCIDFLRAEAKLNTAFKNRPLFPAVDDHLHQAASKANWATGIVYDPENDGTEMPASLGVHEHWNNYTDKKYSGDLATGTGIELVFNKSIRVSNEPVINAPVFKVYPNPFAESVTIEGSQVEPLQLCIYNSAGKLVYKNELRQAYTWKGESQNGMILPDGLYIIKLLDKKTGRQIWSDKLIRRKA